MQLALRYRAALNIQKGVSWLNLPWFSTLFVFLFRIALGYKCKDLQAVRSKFANLIKETKHAPLIIASNHLTMVDSMLIMLFLSSPGRMCFNFRLLPWNVPEISNFGTSIPIKIMCYLGKCVYVERKGSLESRKLTTEKLKYLLTNQQILCLFPEGGRSRTGQIDRESTVYGIGSLIQEVPNCQVATVYVRGDQQKTFGFFPKRGDRIHLDVQLATPKTTQKGRRGAKDLALQVVDRLIEMEKQYFENRK